MPWTGTFSRSVSDIFTAVDGYFGNEGVSLGGPLRMVQIDNGSTANRMVFQSVLTSSVIPNLPSTVPPIYVGQIAFTGTGLTAATQATPGGLGSIPVLTGGTVTGIEVRFNTEVNDLITALSQATTTAQQDQIVNLMRASGTEANLNLPANLNALIVPDAFSAAQLGTAMMASYTARDIAPIRAFFNQFNFNFATTANNPNTLTNLIGFDNADILTGGAGPSLFYGGGGNDTMTAGGAGNIQNQMDGQQGADLYLMGPGGDWVNDTGGIGDGPDIVSYELAPGGVVVEMDVTGTVPMQGWAQGDNYAGVEGITGSRFNDVLIGRSTVLGELSSDILNGGAGDDTIYAGEGQDTITGGPGFDQIDGGPNQTVLGNPGAGDMAVFAAGPGDVHFFVLQNGTVGGTAIPGFTNVQSGLLAVTPRGGVDLLVNIELLNFNGQVFTVNQINLSAARLGVGDANANTLTGGNATADLLFGRDGNDVLSGLGGNDILDGGLGNDRLTAGAGNDTVSGGDGADTLSGNDGDDFIFGGETSADQRDVIFGGTGNDSIDGGYGNDELRGDDGADTVTGGFGADTVIGGAGNDLLTGEALSDLMFGNDGADFINGGFGYDRLNGGAGADKFYHLGVRDHGSDWVQDYTAADGDVLVFGNASATRAQFQVNFTETAGAGAAGVQEGFVIYRPTGQILWALVDGGGQSEINLQIGGQVFDLMA